MSHARYLIGDVFERMAELPDASVDLVLTSPPFLALRSYLPADHPDKAKEIGSEPTPAAFLDTLLHLTAEWRRLLAPHGSIAVELGDTYSGNGESGWERDTGEYRRENRSAASAAGRMTGQRGKAGWPLAKSLCGIPHLYHLSLAYGRNLLTGEPSPAGLWRVRNVVAWCRPNPPVGALGDKFRPGTSYMTIACVSDKRYFDLDAVRMALTEPGAEKRKTKNHSGANPRTGWSSDNDIIRQNPAGAPPLDWWAIPTQPYKGAHYATWPMALCERPIKAMVPQRVCLTCGEPSRRIVENPNAGHGANAWNRHGTAAAKFHRDVERPHFNESFTTGWTDCGCHPPVVQRIDNGAGSLRSGTAEPARHPEGTPAPLSRWRNGLVLDPFAGSGTTLASATGHGRDAIGIDLDARNAELAAERVGMFLEVDHPEAVA